MGVPARLGRYNIESELGQGSMGRVYLAHDPAIDRKVAIKTVILPEGLSRREHDEIRGRFQREVQAAGRLAHPNIVTVYDLGEDATVGMFVAMEYIEGRELADYTVPDALLPPRTVASIGCQAADALAYAHRHGIVHRDIKPQNLILVGEQSVKIADFGLAKQVGASLTTTGALLGTPYYMSPEQIRGIEVDGRSDLFSLAVVIYELLTGKRPFRGESISTVIYRITSEPPIAPDLSRFPDSADGIKAFLGRTLAKNPDDRFQTGDEFARALREAFTTSAAAEPGATPAVAAVLPRHPRDANPTKKGVVASPSSPAAAARPVRHPRTPGTRSRRRGAGTRKKSSISLMPLFVILMIVAASGFFYRDELWNLVQGREPGAPVRPAESDSPGDGLAAADSATPTDAADGVNRPTADGPTKTGGAPAGTGRMGTTVAGQAGDEGGGEDAGAPKGKEIADPSVPPKSASGGGGTSLASPAPVPPPVTTLVELASSPPGAAFFVDDRRLPGDRVPSPEAGQHLVVRAVLDCREVTRDVEPADAGKQIVLELPPAEVAIQIVSEPAGAAVKIDGKRRGKTPATVTLDACLGHTVVLDRDGYKQWQQQLTLAAGRLEAPATLTAELEPLPTGTLVIPQPPYPLTIRLGGRQVVKPGQRMTVVVGNYRVAFSSEELMFKREVRVRVTADGTATPDIQFPPAVPLSVVAQPGNANIEISNDAYHRDLGPPPILGENVVAGTYRLKCRFLHNGEEQEKSVHLAAGDSSRVRFVATQP